MILAFSGVVIMGVSSDISQITVLCKWRVVLSCKNCILAEVIVHTDDMKLMD